MQARTSLSHPLLIATVDAGSGAGAGRIGISLCPGKQQRHAWTGAWARDLDLRAVRDWGATTVVTLVEDHELTSLGVTAMGATAASLGLAWVHLPIPDATAPGPAFERDWRREGARLRVCLRGGESIFVHCKGGLGRAGTIAARLLVELGEAPALAIARVRAARPGALEVRAQERHVHGCSAVAPEI